jgi:serine/threonine protein kinase
VADEAPSVNASDELLGATLGNCVIEALLGEGGMSRVYRAHQKHLDRNVAIKVLPPYYAADQAFVDRFKREAKAMAQLSHPNIVTIHDAGKDKDRLYIILEYIGGGNLKQRMLKGMTLSEVTRVIREIAGALTYAHDKGFVHRDVKPMNVLMDANGRAVLSDFGIAKVMATSTALTRVGAGVGTPEYMSPEQCRGAEVDARADIYALGVMLYEMLTGRTPFVADNFTALAHSHIYEYPPAPSALNPHISPAVQSVIMKALEKDPANRFQKATEMAVALEQALAAQTPVRVGPRSTPPMLRCPQCQAPNAANQRFCSSCGFAFAPPAPNAYQQVAQGSGGFITCPKCHASNRAINRFCIQCGQSLQRFAAGACPACGTPNAPGLRFCTQCGQQLTP